MKFLKLIFIVAFLSIFILGCSTNNSQKGKKGDFLFRKCASCNKVNY